ncbi:putative Heavy-metal-associated domain-containing protein [Gammaproteobacteria bacterium]
MSDHIHHVPGRLRVRNPALKNNAGQFKSVEESLAGMSGIQALQLNSLTGSIVVNYDIHHIDGAAIPMRLKEHRHVDRHLEMNEPLPVPEGWSWGDFAVNAGQIVGKAVLGTLLEQAFLRSATALVSAIL